MRTLPSCAPSAACRRRAARLAALRFHTADLTVDTAACELECGIGVVDISALVRGAVTASGVRNGVVTVRSMHTTTAVCVNEAETRLYSDIRAHLLALCPPQPTSRWLHNDIGLRDPPPNYTGSVAAWRAAEPINAHAHLAAMLVGSSESVPIADGALALGTWQSLLLLELDGPRRRTVALHVMGE